jgi:hypothetical protein
MIAGEYEMSRRPSGDFMQLLYLAARVVIRADDDGTLTTPGWLSLTTGRPQRWREVAPFRWREIGGPDYLRARVEDGRVMSVLALSQYSFELRPPPLITSRTLHLPLLVFAMAALLLSVIGWPVGAIMRRYYGVQPDFDQPMARARSLTRWSVVAALVFMLGWLIIAAGGGFSGTSELFIRVNQLIGIGVVAGTGVAIWHAYLCLTRPAGWPSRVWSIVLSLALIDLVFFALAFSLFSLGLNY